MNEVSVNNINEVNIMKTKEITLQTVTKGQLPKFTELQI